MGEVGEERERRKRSGRRERREREREKEKKWRREMRERMRKCICARILHIQAHTHTHTHTHTHPHTHTHTHTHTHSLMYTLLPSIAFVAFGSEERRKQAQLQVGSTMHYQVLPVKFKNKGSAAPGNESSRVVTDWSLLIPVTAEDVTVQEVRGLLASVFKNCTNITVEVEPDKK
jgi:hypothetical protein